MASVVDIAPALGQGAVPLQAGPGASPGYSAIDHRRMWTIGLQEGAIDSGSYKVTQNSGGAAMNVDVAANIGAGCVVQGDDVAVQGRYYVAPHAAKITVDVDAADITNPRIDQIILEVEDTTHDSSALNKARVRVLKGTATSGATLDNRSGAAALPNGAMRLADVLVGAGVTSITTANIRDRRPWARGAEIVVERAQNAGGTSNYTTTSAPMVAIDSTNLTKRLECSGVPLLVELCVAAAANVTNADMGFDVFVDGAAVGLTRHARANAANVVEHVTISGRIVPSAGTHTFEPRFQSDGTTTLTAYAAPTPRLWFTLREDVRQNAANS